MKETLELLGKGFAIVSAAAYVGGLLVLGASAPIIGLPGPDVSNGRVISAGVLAIALLVLNAIILLPGLWLGVTLVALSERQPRAGQTAGNPGGGIGQRIRRVVGDGLGFLAIGIIVTALTVPTLFMWGMLATAHEWREPSLDLLFWALTGMSDFLAYAMAGRVFDVKIGTLGELPRLIEGLASMPVKKLNVALVIVGIFVIYCTAFGARAFTNIPQDLGGGRPRLERIVIREAARGHLAKLGTPYGSDTSYVVRTLAASNDRILLLVKEAKGGPSVLISSGDIAAEELVRDTTVVDDLAAWFYRTFLDTGQQVR